MSNIEKSIVPILEADIQSIDYGVPNLNELFNSLDVETQKKITKYTNKDVQKTILINISDKKLNDYFNALPKKKQEQLESMGIRDKYTFLKKLMDADLKKQKEEPKVKEVENVKELSRPQKIVPSSLNFQPDVPSDTPVIKEAPQELFQKDEPTNDRRDKYEQKPPQVRFNELVKIFYSENPYVYSRNRTHELEVKFGTRGIKPLTRNDYDNVIKKLKSFGFTTTDNSGQSYLRINCEYLEPNSNKVTISKDVRIEISGLHNIEDYCKNNDIKSLLYVKSPGSVNFIKKKLASEMKDNKLFKYYPVDFNDFNFRVSYNTEDEISSNLKTFIVGKWNDTRKIFRYLNRVSFRHDDYPVIIDISIVKYSNKQPDKYGRQGYGDMIPVYTIDKSNIFNNPETYEIEIEIDNKKIGPGTKFNSPESILESLRKAIKFVLGGLQGTNFPISYPEQSQVISSYMKMIWKDEYDQTKRVLNKQFIGPNSITLQIVNIAPLDENSNDVNIRKDFVVTDKADGERHLMFISDNGKIYLINSSMDVIFTGAKTANETCFNTLIDGELIMHDKNGKYINLYAAFDIYYFQKDDVRHNTFMLLDKELDIHKSRYYLLKSVITTLKPMSIMETSVPKEKKSLTVILEEMKKGNNIICPIRITTKEFLPLSNKQTIFSACNDILKKEMEGRFEYTTDGLIFTHAFYGVGSQEIGKSGPKTKITWEQSFKWKPPQYNTIDFYVTTEKSATGEDVIKPLFEDGINSKTAVQFTDYKTIELRCGFSEKKDGFINPCQDIIEDRLPQFYQRYEESGDNDYLPKRFYPTEPYDPNAGLCKILLKSDDLGVKQMFSEENEVFGDNTIVEFRYDFERDEGWRWVPLRVRHDKTAKLRRGEKEYGNSYKTCNENWKSIHPAGRITEDMLRTGLGIPDISVSEDKYYNTPAGKLKTEPMKNFHNLYVKKLLIKSVSKQGDSLIDLACGKAGDLSKWIAAKLSFVFGIDLSKDNLENRIDGACARFLKAKKSNKNMPYALFVNGNSAYNIKNGSAMLNDKAKQITGAIFGNGPKDPEKIGKGVARQYGKYDDGFNIASCQFAIHYFLESPDTLQGFLKNLAECTKLNGYFIGTAYDGKTIFNMLKKIKTGESVQINEDGKKIWEIVKGYGSDNFEDDSSSIGYRIDVFQESINQLISEYLVNFDYLDRVMNAYGFKIISRIEANDLGLPDGTGLFSELFHNMLEEISKNKFKAKDYGDASSMSKCEQKISFLNRYFVYKKYTEVNVNKVVLELGEYQENEIQRNNRETTHAIEIAKEEINKIKPKVRKLSKKLLLVPATEAVDELPSVEAVEKEIVKEKTVKKQTEKKKKDDIKKMKPAKKILIVESDEDEV
jgi:hypothetical protein